MSEIQGKTVYMILFNYGDKDFSVIKIMDTLEKAYYYICKQHSYSNNIKMIEVNNPDELTNMCLENSDTLNVCFIKSGKYHKFELSDMMYISDYIIIPMIIE